MILFQAEIERDFRELRKTVESTGLLKSRPVFFMWHLLSILVIDLIGYLILLNFGTSWLPYLTAVALFTTAQVRFETVPVLTTTRKFLEMCLFDLWFYVPVTVVECRTPEREVRGSRPTAAVLCP